MATSFTNMPLTFIEFPQTIQSDILNHMPTEYPQMIEKPYYPTVVNPKDITNIIKEKRFFMACKSMDGKTIWVTSLRPSHSHMRLREFWTKDSQYYVPCCHNKPHKWSANIPWDTLCKMDVKYTGNFLVFTPDDYQDNSIDTSKCTFIPHLQAYIVK
jgi:hypothetical protein